MKRVIIQLIISFLSIAPSVSYAGWSEPQGVVAGSWGSGVGQFYFASGDISDSFPREFGVDKDGLIIIPDSGNKRIVIYNADGTIRATLVKPSELPGLDSIKKWPYGFILYSSGNSVVVNCNYQGTSSGRRPINLCIINYDGSVLAKINFAQVFPYEAGFVTLKNNLYSLYSPIGQLIKTSTTRPLELGSVQSIGIGSGKYKTTVKYPDITYDFVDDQPVEKYYRDKNDNFHRIEIFSVLSGADDVTAYRVHKYSRCSKKIAVLNIPLSTYEPMPVEAADMPTWKPAPIMEYGEPLVAPNGDVYAWARTTTHYKILKWTWKDDPNVPTGPDAPSGLAVSPSINGLYLTWTASPQDPGCVTGYEVARATSAGGVFSTIATTEKGMVKYNDTSATAGTTYYYKVRAKAGSEPSPYTAEVSGKR